MESNRRDRLVQRVRAVRWAAGLGAAGLTAAFSVAAAHAFKGHDGRKATTPARAAAKAAHRVTVPGPDNVPAISGSRSLQPPQQAPQAAAPQEQQQPEQAPQQQAAPPVSGGS
jgi:hypothetical protein